MSGVGEFERWGRRPVKDRVLPLQMLEAFFLMGISPVQEPLLMLQRNLMRAVVKGEISNSPSTKVLIISGSHGDEKGNSALTDLEMTRKGAEVFYPRDCMKVGYRADWEFTNINDTDRPRLTLQDQWLNNKKFNAMTFQVVNLTWYHGDKKRLVRDIQQFRPTVLCLAFCFSLFSDVTTALRECGVSAEMVIEHDLRRLTGRPGMKLSVQQSEVIRQVVERGLCNLLLWGSAGTGKTLLLCECLKIVISKLKTEGGKVKVFIMTFDRDAPELLKKLKDQYLATLDEKVTFIRMSQLCETLRVEHDYRTPQATLNRVIPALSAQHDDAQVLLLTDEVWCCTSEAEPDWRNIETPNNVHWFIALNPSTNQHKPYLKTVNMVIPTNENVLCFQLQQKHRNSLPIKRLYEYWVKHETTGYISLDKDLEVAPALLPDGHLPLWVECLRNTSEVAALEFVATLPQLQQYTSVTVIQDSYTDTAVRVWCRNSGWRCYDQEKIYGTEDQVCVLLDCSLRPEHLSRAVNLLIIVTTYR